jgi:hypothetical protein
MEQLNKTIDKRKLGVQKNKLLRYKAIKELYNEKRKEHPYTPTTKILENYIYPVFFISRTTLYEVLATPITNKLREL